MAVTHVITIIPCTVLLLLRTLLACATSPGLYAIKGIKKVVFPVNRPQQVFTQKNPHPKYFSALQTHNQYKRCKKHTFFYLPTYPIFFRSLQETNIFLGLIYLEPVQVSLHEGPGKSLKIEIAMVKKDSQSAFTRWNRCFFHNSVM